LAFGFQLLAWKLRIIESSNSKFVPIRAHSLDKSGLDFCKCGLGSAQLPVVMYMHPKTGKKQVLHLKFKIQNLKLTTAYLPACRNFTLLNFNLYPSKPLTLP
jgi:hypothetical protein